MAYRRSEAWDDLSLRLDEAFRQQRCYASMSYAHTQMLRHRVLSGDVVEPFPRLFVRTEAWKTLSRADQERYVIRGYAQVHPGAVFCSISAAVMHGLPVSYSLLGQVYVYGSSPSHRGAARVVRLYRPDPTCEMVDGVRVASLAEATVECLCTCDFEDGLAIADGYLRAVHADSKYLLRNVERLARGRWGVGMARDVARHADARAESGGESIARAIMIKGGVPPSDLQREYVNPLEPWNTYRVDFVFELTDGRTVLGEFDGLAKYEDERLRSGATVIDTFMKERQRESRLTLTGASIVRFNWSDLRSPGRLLRMLAAAGVTPETLIASKR
ncbi:hypothetical protein [Enorma massiliensis]|uniref:hypothetical protein n=1 Tax=Enorma massiliensis TaxID=1472761 RepID=UPI0034A4677E